MTLRFQITTFQKFSQFSRVADQSIMAGLTREQLPALMGHAADSDVMRAALIESVIGGTAHSFRDADGNLCQLRAYTR